jgi:transposase
VDGCLPPVSQQNRKEEYELINVGIDVGKRICQAALKAEDGRLLDELRFENTSQGVQELLRHITVQGGEARAVVESTANYWIRIHDMLEDHGVDTILANPRKTKLIAEAKIKSDELDARTLATLLQGNLVFESYVPPKAKQEDRTLIRHRASLVKMRTEIRNRTHAILAKHELQYDYSDLFGKKGVQWLESLQLQGVDQTVLKTNLALLKALDEQVEAVTIEIAQTACNQEDIQILMTMPGVDFYSAMVIASEIGDVKRFPTQWKLVAYAGLAPTQHQSGEYERRGGITKQGSKWLRWILVQAAHHARQHDPRFKTYYDRIAKRRGPQKAVVAVAKEMLVVIWFMLTRREAYRGQDTELVERKLKRMNNLAHPGLQAA